MPYRLLAVAFFILLLPRVLAAAQYESVSIFDAEDCAEYLAGRPGEVLLKRAKRWLNDLPPISVLGVRREIPYVQPKDEIINPKVVWFMDHPGATFEEVFRKYKQARADSDQYHLNIVRTLPAPSHEFVLSDIARREKQLREDERQAMSALEMAAFGIPGQMPTSLENVHAHLISDNSDSLRIELIKDDELIGEVTLPLETLRPGFRNIVPLWQAARQEGDEIPPPKVEVSEAEQQDILKQFLLESGQLALFRQTGDHLFAYNFSVINLESESPETMGLNLSIYVATPCTPGKMARAEFSFPPLKSGQAPLCFSDTFLRLQVPFRRPSEMSVDRPAGFSEKKYQL